MAPGGRRDGHDLGASASEQVYRALVRAYPEEVRSRYADEMVRYFGDLCREESRSSGAKGVALLWARTLPELVFTALKERGAMLPRNAYLPVAPRTAARWGALSALLGGSLGTLYSLAYTLVIAEFPVDWTWWDGQFTVLILFAATLLSILGIFGLYGTLVARSGHPSRLASAGVALAALSATSILALYGYGIAERLGWLWPPGEGFSWWEMNRTMILQEVGLGACVLGLLLLGVAAFRARLFGSLRALPLLVAPLWPASIGLLIVLNMSGMEYVASLSGTLPFLGAALSGWVMLKNHPAEHLASEGGVTGSPAEETGGPSPQEAGPAGPRRSRRPRLVPGTYAGWVLAALLILLIFGTGAYAARETALYKTFVGMLPGADEEPVFNEGPVFNESKKLNLTKNTDDARVTLKWAYADENSVVVEVYMEDLEGERSVAGHPAELEPGYYDEGVYNNGFRLTDESGTEFRLPGLEAAVGAIDAPKSFKPDFKVEEKLEPDARHRFRLEVSLVEVVAPSREFWGPEGEKRPPPEPVGEPIVFDFEIPVRPVPVVEVNEKDTAKGITLTLERVINSPGKPQAVICYEPPDDEHSWYLHGGKGTYLGGWGSSGSMTGVPPASCQNLQLESRLEGRSSVGVTMIEGMLDCPSGNAKAAQACYDRQEKIIRGPWIFEFDVPDS